MVVSEHSLVGSALTVSSNNKSPQNVMMSVSVYLSVLSAVAE